MRRRRVTSPVAAAVAGLVLAGCGQKPSPPEPKPAVEAAAPRLPALPPPNLERAAFLQALDAAASAYAAGLQDDSETLVGRRFVLRQPFGCVGPAPAKAEPEPGRPAVNWRDGQKSLELSLRPADWTRAPVMAGSTWEVIEGFWFARPWLRAEVCPASPSPTAAQEPGPEGPSAKPAPAKPEPSAPAASASPTSSPFTAGLAAVYPPGGSRLDRRDGRALQYTVRGDPPLLAPPEGYRLVLEGRFAAFPNGRAIGCYAPNVETRPVCVAAAEVDRIAFEDAKGQLLSEWRRG